jgi:hypothetical protein
MAPGEQEVMGEGVPEPVWVEPGQACQLGPASEQVAYPVR